MSSIILVKYLLLEERIRHFREYRFYVRLRGSTGGGSAGNDVYAREIERYAVETLRYFSRFHLALPPMDNHPCAKIHPKIRYRRYLRVI